jgi:hypothetical protein
MIMGSNAYTSAFVSPGYTSTIPGRALLTDQTDVSVFQKKQSGDLAV